MKDKNKNIVWKRIINKKKEQLTSFDKVKRWLDKQCNFENLELLADIACQQQKINHENLKPIHWKKRNY